MDGSKKPVLGYWDIRGICNPIRYLLAFLEVDYDDKLYRLSPNPEVGMQEWFGEKHNLGLLFPNIPYWIDGTTKLSESKVILRYLVKKYGAHLLPSSFELETQMELLENVGADVSYSLLLNSYKKASDEALGWIVERNKGKIECFSKHLGGNDWFIGNKISYADFIIYEAVKLHETYNPNLVPQDNLKEFMKRFEELPAIANYMKSPRFIRTPFNSPTSDVQIK